APPTSDTPTPAFAIRWVSIVNPLIAIALQHRRSARYVPADPSSMVVPATRPGQLPLGNVDGFPAWEQIDGVSAAGSTRPDVGPLWADCLLLVRLRLLLV
ncbi:MAG: hypothetical protein ABJD68_07830, partial [Nakamurella sp.]